MGSKERAGGDGKQTQKFAKAEKMPTQRRETAPASSRPSPASDTQGLGKAGEAQRAEPSARCEGRSFPA